MNRNKKAKFTIIIPTRERCDVLQSSLKTCTTQDYDNFEIIVSDNFSQDKTKEVADSFKDNRIRYINTGKRISAADNWEFALAHVDGGYVTFLGDDDAILPGALAELNKIISRTGCEAVSCKTVGYSWPDHINEYERNVMRVPLKASLVKLDSKEMLTDVVNFRRPHDELPLLYRSFVSYDVIKRAMQESGKFFHSMLADIYSGIALACVMETYYYSFKPYVISGASRHSAGAVSFTVGKDHQASKKILSEDNMPIHRRLAMAPSGPILVAECFLQAQDYIPYARQFKVDIKKCIKQAVIESVNFPKQQYELIIDAVKKIALLNQVDRYAAKIIRLHKSKPRRFYKPVLGFNIIRGHLVIDCAEFGARDVYEAAVLCGHILALKKRDYLSPKGIIKTTISYVKREIINSNMI